MRTQQEKRIIPLQALTVFQAIDMGLLTTRTHFTAIYKVILPFGLITCLVVYLMNHYFDMLTMTVYPMILLQLGAISELLIRKAVQSDWIIPAAITPHGKKALASETTAQLVLKNLGRQLLLMLSFVLLLIPGLLYFRKLMFAPERKYLDNPESKIQNRVWGEIKKKEMMNLEGNVLLLLCFWIFLSLLCFLFIDLSCTLLFSYPIFLQRFLYEAQLFYLLNYDPYVMVTWTAILFFIYPPIRFAWFFSYISLRVQSDCWDISTSINREAERLKLSMQD
ncbi:MAG: hypothetical protein R3C11_22795 [Planctomycetaceae bacterium]